MRPYPLKFYEIYKPKVWGGRKIETVLGKHMPEGPIGESWELSDHFDDVSIVRNGPLEGRSLREIWHCDPEGVLGTCLASRDYGEFPLLVKFIDAAQWLSVQVHPDDEYARLYGEGESGKEEAWYVIDAAEGARLVAGLREGTTREQFRHLLEEGRIEECLHYVDVKAGDIVHVSAGTVHSIGPGILLCEIQETSDATYRVWDWGRVGLDGRSRPLHIDKAIDVIRFESTPAGKACPDVLQEAAPRREMLTTCRHFRIEKLESREPFELEPVEGSFQVLVSIHATATVVCEGERYVLGRADTMLLPAALPSARVEPEGALVLLRAFVSSEG